MISLIKLDKDTLLPSDYDNITFPLTMLGWELREKINSIMYSEITSFYKDVEKEGIKIWG